MQIIHPLSVDIEDPEQPLRGPYFRAVSLGEKLRCGKCHKKIPLGEYRYTKSEPIDGGLAIFLICSDCHIQISVDNAPSWNGQTRKERRERYRKAFKRMGKKMRETSLQGGSND